MPQQKTSNIYDSLATDVSDQVVRQVVIGVNWTLVESDIGCGLSQTPRRDAPGCQPISRAGQLTNMTLAELVALVRSDNPMEMSIGMAALNSFHNRFDLQGGNDNGLDVFSSLAGPVTVIGRFPGLADRINDLRIIEREPRDGEYPESAATELLPKSEGVIITAATFANGSATELINLAQGASIAIVGPGTPLSPILFERGVEVLAGIVIHDVAGAAIAVAEGAAVKTLKNYGRYTTLRANSSA